MLEFFTSLGLIAFVATIPLAILTNINTNKTNQLLKNIHPELGRVSVFEISKMNDISEETRTYAKKAKSFLIYMLLDFFVMCLSGMMISTII
ncbi:MAG: hypothetical protein PHI79_04350 [Sulfurovaceae bacterium]|nr:hypothetical protein [Sulfurovaceae bacterium]